MKRLFLFILLGVGTVLFAQKKEYDTKIMGCFRGAEQNQQEEGLSKYWISCRLDKGKSVLLFVTVHEDGRITQNTENGKWWTKDGKYYEFHKYSNLTDVYHYEVLDNGDVFFKSIEIIGKKDDSYHFIDYKIEDD